MDIIKENYRKQAEALIPKFARRNMEAFYCETAEEAKKLVLLANFGIRASACLR